MISLPMGIGTLQFRSIYFQIQVPITIDDSGGLLRPKNTVLLNIEEL